MACNYDADATDSEDSCTYAEDYYTCSGTCINDSDYDGICDEFEIIDVEIEFQLDLSEVDIPYQQVYISGFFDDQSCDFLAGDFNGDLASTVEDMLLLLSEFNNCGLPQACLADLDDSGFVSVEDLLLFLSYFGSSCGDD